VLDSIDETIERTQAVITATEQLRDAMRHELLTRGLPGWHSHWYESSRFGVIPTNWKVVRLDEIAHVVGGSTPSRAKEEYWNGDIPWVVPSELSALPGRFLTSTRESITEKGMKAAGLRVIPAGSVLLTSRATIGAVAINTAPVVTNQGFKRKLPGEEHTVFGCFIASQPCVRSSSEGHLEARFARYPEPMSAPYQSIRYGDTTINYEVRRSVRRKKTVEITVNGSGVLVQAPATCPDQEVQAVVRKKAAWILHQSTQTTLTAAPRQFISGETLPYLGRNLRLVVNNTPDVRTPQVLFDHWRFHIEAPLDLLGPARPEGIRRAFMRWYRARAADRLPNRIDRWLPRFPTQVQPRILIRDQRLRWASCAPDGTMRFNWRVVMLKPALIDYVVVHELACPISEL
jgi:predicted metal-dependent hydrolase